MLCSQWEFPHEFRATVLTAEASLACARTAIASNTIKNLYLLLLLNLMDPSFENKDAAAEGIGFKAFTTCWTRVHHDNDEHSVLKTSKKSHFDNIS